MLALLRPASVVNRAPGRERRVEIAAAGKSPEERRARRERARERLKRRRADAVQLSQTQFDDHWYEVRGDGVWEERRGRPPGQRPTPRTRPVRRREHSFRDLVAVTLTDPPPPPEEWVRADEGADYLLGGDADGEADGEGYEEEAAAGEEWEKRRRRGQVPRQRQQRQGGGAPAEEAQQPARAPRPIALPSEPWKDLRRLRAWRQQQQQQQGGQQE
ncbi:hypothetical protein FOA52_002903 [Chlamydomonas sp. UWO 241]|nr:hypothetical protein FOA52_002903 [Chlamydomonas sp. UWO 241]